MILQIILSLGSVYAFIPVIIVFILILAARGAIGRDFFEVFGITSLVGWTKGIAAGGAGRGIGRGRAYKSNVQKTNEAAGSAGSFLLAHQQEFYRKGELDRMNEAYNKGEVPKPKKPEKGLGLKPGRFNLFSRDYNVNKPKNEYNSGGRIFGTFGSSGKRIGQKSPGGKIEDWRFRRRGQTSYGYIRAGVQGQKEGYVKNMSEAQIHAMLQKYGMDNRTAGLEPNQLREFAAYNLSILRISDYYDTVVRPAAQQTVLRPLTAPQASPHPQGVRTALGDWYRSHYGARHGRAKKHNVEPEEAPGYKPVVGDKIYRRSNAPVARTFEKDWVDSVKEYYYGKEYKRKGITYHEGNGLVNWKGLTAQQKQNIEGLIDEVDKTSDLGTATALWQEIHKIWLNNTSTIDAQHARDLSARLSGDLSASEARNLEREMLAEHVRNTLPQLVDSFGAWFRPQAFNEKERRPEFKAPTRQANLQVQELIRKGKYVRDASEKGMTDKQLLDKYRDQEKNNAADYLIGIMQKQDQIKYGTYVRDASEKNMTDQQLLDKYNKQAKKVLYKVQTTQRKILSRNQKLALTSFYNNYSKASTIHADAMKKGAGSRDYSGNDTLWGYMNRMSRVAYERGIAPPPPPPMEAQAMTVAPPPVPGPSASSDSQDIVPRNATEGGDEGGNAEKMALMGDMSIDEIKQMCNAYGIPAKNIKDKNKYAAYAASMISDPEQIRRFKAEYLNRGAGSQQQPPGADASQQQAAKPRIDMSTVNALGIKSQKDITNDNFYAAWDLKEKPQDFQTARSAYLRRIKEVHEDRNKDDENAHLASVLANAAYEHARRHMKEIWSTGGQSTERANI